MSIYSDVSKKVGFNDCFARIPMMHELTEVITKSEAGDVKAFEQLFMWYRYCVQPVTQGQLDVINKLANEFLRIRKRYM